MRELVRASGRYRDSPFGPWLTNVLALLNRTSQSLSLLTSRLMLGAILLDTTQESRLASWTMEVLLLMPESGMVSRGQTETPRPVRLMRQFVVLTKSSTYDVMPRRDRWLREPNRLTLPCGRHPVGLQ